MWCLEILPELVHAVQQSASAETEKFLCVTQRDKKTETVFEADWPYGGFSSRKRPKSMCSRDIVPVLVHAVQKSASAGSENSFV